MVGCTAEACSYMDGSVDDNSNNITALFRSSKNLDEIYCSNFQLKIRMTRYDLIIKLIIQMDGKL